jgi:aspartate racemase
MKTVGIIGGLGPETTSEFYLDLVFSCYKKHNISRPGIVISSVPLPYKIEEDLILNNKNIERYIPYLVKEAEKLELSGVDFIVMPCNSLHVFIEKIRKAVKIPVLSIIEETVKFMKQNKFTKVGIVSTSATIQNKLYEDAFEKNNINYVTPDDFQQAKLGKFILNLVNGKHKNSDREELIKIIDDFNNKNVDCVALACTDLQLLIPNHSNLKIFDTMKILVDATVNRILE